MSEQILPTNNPSDMPEPDDDVAKYFRWLERCRQAEAKQRREQPPTVSPSLIDPSMPWEAADLSDEARQKLETQYRYEKFVASGRKFSLAAYAVVHSQEMAVFFDDVKCDFLGDSEHPGWFKAISPTSNDSPFDVQFDYSEGVVNAYTELGTILHVRETRDPAARSLEQKFFIVAANILTGKIRRLYAENKKEYEPDTARGSGFDEIMTLSPVASTSDQELTTDVDEDSLTATYRGLHDTMKAAWQPKLKFAGRGAMLYKPEGYTEFNVLWPIARLDEERRLLAQIALATGQKLGERGTVISLQSQYKVAQITS